MKQTVRIGDSLSRKIRDEVSADLKGYVTVEVKNKKTGEIEHQENHNLIVYGGREWLLRRIFGATLPNNEYATNSSIRWVGFGCGGGEAGNPLQAGSTKGQDTDLYQPCRIRFEDDSITSESNAMYASRILPNGRIIPGYYKKISNITIKEDHANPYIENNIKKYPKIIAEIRVELSSDDCNGQNYTENGNLVAYQDINEVGLFISDADIVDPGKSDKYDEIFLDVVTGTISHTDCYVNKTYYSANIAHELTKDASNKTWTVNKLPKNNYTLQYKSNSDTDWTSIDSTKSVSIESNGSVIVTLDDSNKITVKNSTDVVTAWTGTVINVTNVQFRLVSNGGYILQYKNAIPANNNLNKDKVQCELQYRNYSSENWITIDTYEFNGDDNSSIRTVEIPCLSNEYPDINVITNFRVRETINKYKEVSITHVRTDLTSYNTKYYMSNDDVKKISIGDYFYTDPDNELNPDSSEDTTSNYIPRTAPIVVIDKYDPTEENTETYSADTAYIVVERQNSLDHTYGNSLHGYAYSPSKASPYTLFSRVSLSSIRKTVDREIILIWKIYC